ncbi:hypothetical protein PybrP1_013017 [[Pythium] brassicae (nom. inval.)]|nr:hypothetical protein PybrP1_013017 [[Pythium] brassicae (nom. inval.)]
MSVAYSDLSDEKIPLTDIYTTVLRSVGRRRSATAAQLNSFKKVRTNSPRLDRSSVEKTDLGSWGGGEQPQAIRFSPLESAKFWSLARPVILHFVVSDTSPKSAPSLPALRGQTPPPQALKLLVKMVSIKFAPFVALIVAAVAGSVSAAPQVHAGVHRTLRQQGTVNLIVTLKDGTENTLSSIKESGFATPDLEGGGCGHAALLQDRELLDLEPGVRQGRDVRVRREARGSVVNRRDPRGGGAASADGRGRVGQHVCDHAAGERVGCDEGGRADGVGVGQHGACLSARTSMRVQEVGDGLFSFAESLSSGDLWDRLVRMSWFVQLAAAAAAVWRRHTEVVCLASAPLVEYIRCLSCSTRLMRVTSLFLCSAS